MGPPKMAAHKLSEWEIVDNVENSTQSDHLEPFMDEEAQTMKGD